MSTEVTPLEPFGVVVQPSEAGASLAGLEVPPLRRLVREHHLLVLRGFRSFGSADELSSYAERWGEITEWPFGTVLELVEREQPEDHIFDHSYMPMHWDGMYREHVPEFQVFQCVEAPGGDDGGETTFSNTTSVLTAIEPKLREQWAKVTGNYYRKMEYYESVCISPLVTTHPDTGAPVIRYQEPTDPTDLDFINHPDLEFTGLPADELADVHKSLREALYAPEHFYAHAWQTGDLVVTDNYTLLHGRNAFTAHTPRHLRRVHVLGDPPLVNPALQR